VPRDSHSDGPSDHPGSDDSGPARLPRPLQAPAALWSLAGQAARQLPGVSLTERELQRVEHAVLRQLKDRLDAVDDTADLPLAAPMEEAPEESTTPTEVLAGLLRDSTVQTGPQARDRLYRWLLQQLLPDQARILAALSDGSTYPLVHVTLRGPMGGSGESLLDNASTVGRSAGVALPEQVPLYLTHLRSLGLVEEGPEDESLRETYDIAETDSTVRTAVDRADGGAVRTVRRTLRLSATGHELWAACQAETTDEP
jgi:Abortive infection alpha